MAALRADAGDVTLAVPEQSLHVGLALEPVKLAWTDDDALEKLEPAAERANALAIGPGLGRSDARTALVRALLERIDLPQPSDADGLYALEPVARRSATALTPHSGELARLLGRDSAWVDAHRLAAREGAQRFGAVVLLKGADTIVAAPAGDVVVCDAGHRHWPRQEPATCSPESWRRFSRKGSMRWPRPPPQQWRNGTAATLRTPAAGVVASDLLTPLPSALER